MKAAFIHDFASIEGIEIGQLPQPFPDQNEVLVQMHYAGVNPVDWKIAEGHLKARMPYEFPIILGWDAAGIVLQTNVKEFAINDEVFVYARREKQHAGTYADYIALPLQNIAKKPRNLTMAQAAAIPLTALTAWQSIFDTANVKKGETILIHAGAGGVGGMAIQLAKWKGAKIVTTASKHNFDYCFNLGADEVIDYNNEDFTKHAKVDVVFDTVGGMTLEKSYNLLREKSRLISIVSSPSQEKALLQGALSYYVFVQPNHKQLTQISELFEQGKLIAPEIKEFSFQDVKHALYLSKEGKTHGKMVIKIK